MNPLKILAGLACYAALLFLLSSCEQDFKAHHASVQAMDELNRRGYLWYFDRYAQEDIRQIIESAANKACR